jgi:VIT1/CCC1 family predicted Fe2+/Mn2+ transporter
MNSTIELYIRNIIFGISDSLVSTVGLLSGIDASGTTKQVVLLTGIIYAFVEAFSMAVGSFLSEQSTEQYATKNAATDSKPFVGGAVMFVSFVLASFIPIVPYILLPVEGALWLSIGLSIVALFIVGIVSARMAKINLFQQGLKTALLGGAAIVIGVVVGKFVKVG